MATYAALDSALRKFSARADRVRQDLFYCDVASPQTSTRTLRRNVHAAAYVYLAAAVESYVSDTLAGIIDEINASNLSLPDLRLSLFAISCAPDFDALQNVRGLKKWNRRVDILGRITGSSPCVLNVEHLPLDGRTIRPEHFATIWGVFGFEGSPIPSPRHSLALRDLAESRNSVAHGNEDAHVIAGQRTVKDTLALLERMEDMVLHLYYAGALYLDNEDYRRQGRIETRH